VRWCLLLLGNLNELQESPIGIPEVTKFHAAQKGMVGGKCRRLGEEVNTLLIEVTMGLLYIGHVKRHMRGAEGDG
jgi:hypothetical protein